jgi:hypothetical protein
VKLDSPKGVKTNDLNSHSAFDGLVWLVRAGQKSWIFAILAIAVFGLFILPAVSKNSEQNLAAIPLGASAILGLGIGVGMLLRSTAQAQGRSILGQLGHILKGIFIAGLILLILAIAMYMIAKATGYSTNNPAPVESQSN